MAEVTIRDELSPRLLALARRMSSDGRRQVHEAMGLVVKSRTERTWGDPSMRPSTWAPLKPSTARQKQRQGKASGILQRNQILMRAWSLVSDSQRAVVGTAQFYAKFHQSGTKTIPARPMLPFSANGEMTPEAKAQVQRAAELAIRAVIRKETGQSV